MTETPSNYGFALTGKIARTCLKCGSLIGDTDAHDRWHADLLEVQILAERSV